MCTATLSSRSTRWVWSPYSRWRLLWLTLSGTFWVTLRSTTLSFFISWLLSRIRSVINCWSVDLYLNLFTRSRLRVTFGLRLSTSGISRCRCVLLRVGCGLTLRRCLRIRFTMLVIYFVGTATRWIHRMLVCSSSGFTSNTWNCFIRVFRLWLLVWLTRLLSFSLILRSMCTICMWKILILGLGINCCRIRMCWRYPILCWWVCANRRRGLISGRLCYPIGCLTFRARGGRGSRRTSCWTMRRRRPSRSWRICLRWTLRRSLSLRVCLFRL